MGRLPLRNLLEFEVVWALRDYESFAVDVREGYGRLPAAKLNTSSRDELLGTGGKVSSAP